MDNQLNHFESKLAYEIDICDLKSMLDAGESVVVIDPRSPDAFLREHIPSAINIPYRTMSVESTIHLSRAVLIVTYCDGIGCNASTKGAFNMAKLGFRVKELVGGIECWKKERHQTSKESESVAYGRSDSASRIDGLEF